MGIIDGWSSINYVDLKKENSSYAAGPLTDEQLGRMMLFGSIGGLFGNDHTCRPVIHGFIFHMHIMSFNRELCRCTSNKSDWS